MASRTENPRLTRSPSTPISVQFFIEQNRPMTSAKKTCVCSPTTHPGSFRCSMHRKTPISVKLSVEQKKPVTSPKKKSSKKTCVCSPTTHPGSFRCSMHRKTPRVSAAGDETVTVPPSLKRSVMSKSMESIGVVEETVLSRAISAMIGPN